MNFRNQDSAQWSHSPLCRESFYSFRSHTLLQFEDAFTNFSPKFPVLSQLTPPSLSQGTLSSVSVHHQTALTWSSRHRFWQIKSYIIWNLPVRLLLAFPHYNRRRSACPLPALESHPASRRQQLSGFGLLAPCAWPGKNIAKHARASALTGS